MTAKLIIPEKLGFLESRNLNLVRVCVTSVGLGSIRESMRAKLKLSLFGAVSY